ncbi:MAG: hypothetical protein WC829_10755 [Hyphomicrobium sp.]
MLTIPEDPPSDPADFEVLDVLDADLLPLLDGPLSFDSQLLSKELLAGFLEDGFDLPEDEDSFDGPPAVEVAGLDEPTFFEALLPPLLVLFEELEVFEDPLDVEGFFDALLSEELEVLSREAISSSNADGQGTHGTRAGYRPDPDFILAHHGQYTSIRKNFTRL